MKKPSKILFNKRGLELYKITRKALLSFLDTYPDRIFTAHQAFRHIGFAGNPVSQSAYKDNKPQTVKAWYDLISEGLLVQIAGGKVPFYKSNLEPKAETKPVLQTDDIDVALELLCNAVRKKAEEGVQEELNNLRKKIVLLEAEKAVTQEQTLTKKYFNFQKND